MNHAAGARPARCRCGIVRAVTPSEALLTPARLFGLFVLPFLVSAPATARERNTIMALYAPGSPVTGDITLTITSAEGVVTRIGLHDDGVIPDEAAKDGSYAGGNWFTGTSGTATLAIGSKVYKGGTFTFPAEQNAKGLSISLSGDQLVLDSQLRVDPEQNGSEGATGAAGQAGAAGQGAMGQGAMGQGAMGQGAMGQGAMGQGAMGQGGLKPPPGAEGGQTTGALRPPLANGAPAASRTGTAAPATWEQPGVRPDMAAPGTSVWPAVIGIGVVAGAALLALMAFRSRAGGAPGPSERVQPEPERGLVGRLPAPSEGLTLWVSAPDEVESLVEPLLATLADHHRVIVVAAGGRTLPRVNGGPVYRATQPTAPAAMVLLAALRAEGAGPIAILGLDLDAATLTRLAEQLPSGTGGVALSPVAEDLPALARVDFQAIRGGWMARFRDTEVRVAEGSDGSLVAV